MNWEVTEESVESRSWLRLLAASALYSLFFFSLNPLPLVIIITMRKCVICSCTSAQQPESLIPGESHTCSFLSPAGSRREFDHRETQIINQRFTAIMTPFLPYFFLIFTCQNLIFSGFSSLIYTRSSIHPQHPRFFTII